MKCANLTIHVRSVFVVLVLEVLTVQIIFNFRPDLPVKRPDPYNVALYTVPFIFYVSALFNGAR